MTIRGADRVTGQWDRFRIEQVLINLLTNALRYGGGTPIEIEVCSRGETAELSIRDHGNGIALEDQERIFRRFERAIRRTKSAGWAWGSTSPGRSPKPTRAPCVWRARLDEERGSSSRCR